MLRTRLLLTSLTAILTAVSILLQPIPTARAAQAGSVHQRIAFVTVDRTTRTVTLNLANPDGSGIIPLITSYGIFSPVWSPDGTMLAFSAQKDETSRFYVFVINSDGSDLRQISAKSSFQAPSYPVWSPDGKQLLFINKLGGGGSYFAMFRANADGSGEEQLQLNGIFKSLYNTWLAWSPDGSKVAVFATSETDWQYGQLTFADLDGGNAQPLPTAPDGHSYSFLEWSRDGAKIVLFRILMSDGKPETLAIADADGSNLQVIVNSPPINISSASWSPDAKQIVFVANKPVTFDPADLWIVNADGSNLHKLSIPDEVGYYLGTSWGLLPADLAAPSAPISLIPSK
ncbi:MAG: hypothetical protein U0528_06095 [Anaerolineae bacterium]